MPSIKIKNALVSVFCKDNLNKIVRLLHENEVSIYSTGGTQKFIERQGVPTHAVETLTGYPSILGGRVKTLHPKILGGVLYRRDSKADKKQVAEYKIPSFDLIIVDLYPFEETVASGVSEQDIIEKIDIGGISLIRAGAKNFKDVLIISSREQYDALIHLLKSKKGETSLLDRRHFAAQAFDITSHYDTAIFNYFNKEQGVEVFKKSERESKVLRYGENPHQKGVFYGDLSSVFDQLHGKALSYNNLVDIDSAMQLIEEFGDETAFAILKHNNACGVATSDSVAKAYQKALSSDTVSAFGGVLITNKTIDKKAAKEIDNLFFEVLIAPMFTEDALAILKSKKNRALLLQKKELENKKQFKSLLNGVLEQDKDLKIDECEEVKVVTQRNPSEKEMMSLLFANKICKQSKSNAIVLAVDGQMFSSGIGQTSRVDALKQAVDKAKNFGFNLSESVMASDAFFPFSDCVEIAYKEGIKAIIQPGGSIRDQESIDVCNTNGISMVFTGKRHFKH